MANSAFTVVRTVSGTSNQIDSSGGTTPVISISASYVGQSSITTLGTITTGTWNGTTIAIANGGTNATTASAALTNLGALPIAGGTMTGNLILNADPTAALGAVTKQYADAISQGLTFKDSCYAASTANLNATYLNGVAGVGATLTNNGSLAAFSIDGTSPASSSRILVKDQSTAFQNGIYTVTIVGSGSVAWILTRSTDYNTPSEIAPGDFILVDNGTINANTAWIETATVTVIGTDSINFSQFGNTGTVTSVSGTAGQIDVATGTTTPVISISASYVGQTSITTLGTIGTGTWQGTVIGLSYGGTNANLTASNGGIFYSTASAGAILAGTATANQVLLSGSSTTPAWSTATYPATTTINQLLYSSSANTIAGLATANSGVLITSSGGIPSISSTLPTAVQTNITQLGTITVGTWNGTTITVPNGGTGNTTFTAYSVICAGTTATGTFQNVSGVGTSGQVLTSNGASALPTWTNPASGVIVNQNSSSVTMVAGSAYYINNASTLVTLTLPTSAAQGDTFIIVGGSSGGWKVAQNASQQINLNSTATTSGTGGSLASTNRYNCMTIRCITANTTFVVSDVSGVITVV